MKNILLIINIFAILFGGGISAYMLVSVDVTQSPNTLVTAFIVAIMALVGGLVTSFLYAVRVLLLRKHSVQALLRSQRQGLLVSIIVGIQLALQGFMLWNIFSASILTLVILLLEYYFLSQESTIIT